jgi:hypothetical protein
MYLLQPTSTWDTDAKGLFTVLDSINLCGNAVDLVWEQRAGFESLRPDHSNSNRYNARR